MIVRFIMDREIYERTELEIIKFQTGDVIITSGRGIDPEEDEAKERMR